MPFADVACALKTQTAINSGPAPPFPSLPSQSPTVPAPGCGTQHPLRALGGTRVLLAAAPTTPPCTPPFVTCGDIFPRRGGSLCSLAAVVVVAGRHQRKNYFYLGSRNVCGLFGTPFSPGRDRKIFPQKSGKRIASFVCFLYNTGKIN